MSEAPVDIYFFEAFEEEAEALRRYLSAADPGGSIRAEFTWKAVQEAIADGDVPAGDACPGAVVSVRTQSLIPPAWASNGLEGILTRSTGYDHVLAYREASGVDVAGGYLPIYCNRAVAEHAMLMVLALARRLPKQIEQFAGFHRDGITGFELEGRRAAVFGVGHIGYEAVKIARGFGMDVVGVDVDPWRDDVTYIEPDEAVRTSDVLVCAMDLNDASRGYFTVDRLRPAKRGAVFVNVSRGEISPTTHLTTLLDEGVLGGVGLDAFDGEQELGAALRAGRGPEGEEARAAVAIMGRHDVVLTPHNAFNTEEAVDRKSEHSIRSLMDFRSGGAFTWPVS